MNDPQRLVVGVIGTAASWTLSHAATIAALMASAATAVFMTLSAVEKWRALRAARSSPPAPKA